MPAPTRRAFASWLATLPWLASSPARGADAWPQRPLRWLVGFPPGSSPDTTARWLAEPLAAALGQPVIVDNRPGAGGNLAATLVAQARDGHTLGLMINGNLTTARLLNPATAYEPARDLAPVSLLVVAPLVLVVSAPLAAGGPDAFADAARRAGDRWNHGSPGVGTLAHLGAALLQRALGASSVHVPYAGNPQVVQALLAGDLQWALLPSGVAATALQGGRLAALGVTSAGRSALMPSVPPLAALGWDVPPLEVWNAVAMPRAQPTAHVQRVASALADAVRQPAVRERLLAQGWTVAGTAPEALARRMRDETARLGDAIRALRLAPPPR